MTALREALTAAIAAVEAFRDSPADPVSALQLMDSRCVGFVIEHRTALLAALDDAERINWCEKQWADGIHIEYCAIGIGDVRVLPAGAVFLHNKQYKGDSIRSAIDAARKP
jgi:hypothetical protein